MKSKDQSPATGTENDQNESDPSVDDKLPEDLGETGKELIKKFRIETKEAKREAAEFRAKLEEIEKAKSDAKKAEEDAERNKIAKEELDKLSDIERIEKQLQEERQQRIDLERRLVERETKERFLTEISTLGIRDEVAAHDLYLLVQKDLTQENVVEIAKNAKSSKQYFFSDKPALGSHGGASGTGDNNESHGLTAEEIEWANSIGMTAEQYKKHK